jgi:RNA polymerase sigma factor (sigma-70 family)
MHRKPENRPSAVIRRRIGGVVRAMSLEISSAGAPWHKVDRPAPKAVPAWKRRIDARPMQSQSPAEPNMSVLIVEVARTRDIERFELVFRHFAPRVKAYMARSGSAPGAEELMQETMVSVWNKAAMFDPAKGAASTWVFSIARNLRIDAWRREKHPEFDENDPAFQPASEPAADSRLEAEQSARLVRSALDTLPPDQAQVLRLAYFEDASQTDIAQKLNLPLGTVKSRMRLAFGKLRTILGDTGAVS